MRRRFQVLLADLLHPPSLHCAAARVSRESARYVVLSFGGAVITLFRFAGVLAGWIRGISGAVPQDLKGNSCFAVSPKRVGVGFGVAAKTKPPTPYFLQLFN